MHMKNLKTPLGLFAIAYWLFGMVMNVRMYTGQMWPTWLFLTSIGIGVLFLGINKATKRLPNYQVWQVLIGLLPITVFYVLMTISNGQVLTKPEVEFQSPSEQNNKTGIGKIEQVSNSEIVVMFDCLLTETSLRSLKLNLLNDKNIEANVKAAFPEFQLTKTVGQQDGPGFDLYEIRNSESEIFFISMGSGNPTNVQDIVIQDENVNDEYGVSIGQSIETVLNNRPSLSFHADLHYNIYASTQYSKIGYRLSGNFKSLNDSTFVGADYYLEKWQVEGMIVEYLIWTK